MSKMRRKTETAQSRKRLPQVLPVLARTGRLVRLLPRTEKWLRKWKRNEQAKINALRRQDFEAAAAYIKMKRAFADLICSELAKQPNDKVSHAPPKAQ
jgi:hypothetical protein